MLKGSVESLVRDQALKMSQPSSAAKEVSSYESSYHRLSLCSSLIALGLFEMCKELVQENWKVERPFALGRSSSKVQVQWFRKLFPCPLCVQSCCPRIRLHSHTQVHHRWAVEVGYVIIKTNWELRRKESRFCASHHLTIKRLSLTPGFPRTLIFVSARNK